MSAKDTVIDFLKTAPKAQHGRFSVVVSGNGVVAHNYLQAMRTELSRMRKFAVAHGSKVRKFKMKLDGIEPINNGLEHRINLRFEDVRNPGLSVANEELSMLFGDLVEVDDEQEAAPVPASAVPVALIPQKQLPTQQPILQIKRTGVRFGKLAVEDGNV